MKTENDDEIRCCGNAGYSLKAHIFLFFMNINVQCRHPF